EDARDSVAAAFVLAEDLAEKAPEGGERIAHAVAELDAVLIEGVEDAEFTQGLGEGQSLVACETGADLLQVGGHGSLECRGVMFDRWGGAAGSTDCLRGGPAAARLTEVDR